MTDSTRNRYQTLADTAHWDLIVIGGGASGLGVAFDAISRGFRPLVLEKADFAKGTSSKATKLAHGGVRYLAQGQVGLVQEALQERGIMANIAPHLFYRQSFLIPNYQWWRQPYYYFGMKVYDMLAGRLGIGKAASLSADETARRLPNLNPGSLKGGVVYRDGQFDDARLAINLAQTINDKGGCALNYMGVEGLLKDPNGRINGVRALDQETGNQYELKANAVVNATGVFADGVREMDEKQEGATITPSQGVHLVLDRTFMPSDDAMMIPQTPDGRVLFLIPFHDKIVVGTTDTPVKETNIEPQPYLHEVDFILETAQQYLAKKPTRADVKSVFAGLRPLANPNKQGSNSAKVSRSHQVLISDSGLFTLVGGKWTTFRKMGEDTIDLLIDQGRLTPKPSASAGLLVHGATQDQAYDETNPLGFYGADLPALQDLASSYPGGHDRLHPDYPYTVAQVIWGVRYEMVQTVEDFLSRRVRMLLLDTQAALEMAPQVAGLIAAERGKGEAWKQQQIADFEEVAAYYAIQPLLANQNAAI